MSLHRHPDFCGCADDGASGVGFNVFAGAFARIRIAVTFVVEMLKARHTTITTPLNVDAIFNSKSQRVAHAVRKMVFKQRLPK